MTKFIKKIEFFSMDPKFLKDSQSPLFKIKIKKLTLFYFHPPFEKKKN